MRFFWRKPPNPLTHNCRSWTTIRSGEHDYIEQCDGCGRQRARIYHQ